MLLIWISYGMVTTGFDIDGTRSSRGRVSVDIALIVCGTRARPFGERHGREDLLWLLRQPQYRIEFELGRSLHREMEEWEGFSGDGHQTRQHPSVEEVDFCRQDSAWRRESIESNWQIMGIMPTQSEGDRAPSFGVDE